ncbi:MAG TPA: nitrous oxide-stimulated promoter family protein [Tepidisphaeraceae bacterium]|nr:nitrous oxide-stimulated promoter family protein [Tepidisphaeraceae bacterium]
MTAPPPTPLDEIKLRGDLKTLALFIELYCRHKHAGQPRIPTDLRTHDLPRIAGHEISLCPQCTQLLTHAFVKRSHCPMNPKPACKHCPAHCYHPRYRAAIRLVMRYSGRKMLLGGRLDYLFHLLF